MNILVLGGTGAMGNYLITILAKQGYKVDVTSRKKCKDRDGNIHYIQGNAHEIDFVIKLLASKHYTAIVDFMLYTTQEFGEVYKIYLAHTDQYFFLSTSRVYANSPIIQETSPRLLDVVEDDEYLKTDEYALAKARQEDILNASGKKNYTIIRPYITYSNNRLQLGVLDKDTFIQRALNGKAIVVPYDIMQHTTTLTWGLDVANCIARLIGNAKALGNTFQITTDKTIKWMDVLDIYVSTFKKKIGFCPKVVMIKNCPQLHIDIACYQVIYDRIYDRCFDNLKIREAIGENFKFTDPKVGLATCMESFLENPNFSNLNCRMEATHDYYSHEYTSLTRFPTIKQKIGYLFYRIAPIAMAKLEQFIRAKKYK